MHRASNNRPCLKIESMPAGFRAISSSVFANTSCGDNRLPPILTRKRRRIIAFVSEFMDNRFRRGAHERRHFSQKTSALSSRMSTSTPALCRVRVGSAPECQKAARVSCWNRRVRPVPAYGKRSEMAWENRHVRHTRTGGVRTMLGNSSATSEEYGCRLRPK